MASVHGAVEGWAGAGRGGRWVVAEGRLGGRAVVGDIGNVWLGEEELAFEGGRGADCVVESGGYAREREDFEHGKVAEDELD